MNESTAKAVTEKPLERYARILEIIAGFPNGVSPAVVGDMLELPKASAYRLIRSLAEVGLVEMTAPPAATCRIGKRLTRILFSSAADDWFVSAALPTLNELAAETGQACFVARLSGFAVRSMEMVAPNNQLRAYIIPGQEIPLHAGASAKAILAHQSDDFIASVLGNPLVKFTPYTRTDVGELQAELKEIRSSGIAYCVNEDVEGFGAIAAPILVGGQRVQQSLCITGTTHSLFEAAKDRNIALVRKMAERLSKMLERKMQGDPSLTD
ncbi:IclR family transcriptional regulator [Rhizobium sp. YJ-22]|uniref:IclR family transcriptional regulator n=1 Tax=Rhizobium sp. YJ-22 TaxID=3037556 RepID=UPI0024121665|nr:IclR family transcriptional regulator [Rhizobium sp. YJ-22]MDG3576563.1 IclR family transcriptional regulator [Rhizobium sp. YJ-22]